MRPIGLLNPKNATESASGFKEGLVLVDTSAFKIHKDKAGERQPYLALAWNVTRLDEDSQPMADGDGNPVTEELTFSLGGTSLLHARPGNASSPDDDDITDLGTEINTEGPTIFLVNQTWKPDKKSGLVNLQDSLASCGASDTSLDRVWAEDYVGSIFSMKSKPSGQTITRLNTKTGKMEDQSFSYKVVDKIVKGFGKITSTTAKPVKIKSAAAAANGKPVDQNDAEAALKPFMDDLVGKQKSGEKMTKKALAAHINRMVSESSTPNLVVSLVNLVRDDKWLLANGAKFDFSFNPADNSISFS